MAASSVQNPLVQTESKSSKKKKAKAATAAAERTESPAPASPEQAASVSGTNEISENAYIRELKKNIRNTTKKITNASKTKAVINENKDKTPEELIAAKVINADQKKQVDNIPALQAELARFEEQLAQHQKIDEEYRATVASVKTETEKSLTEKHEQEKAAAIAEVKNKAEADAKKTLHDGFLVISKFLRLAAHRRNEAPESTDDLDMALEGILLGVYNGDEAAVDTMVKLYNGTDDTVLSVASEPLQTTFATVKAMSSAHLAPLYETEPSAEPEAAPAEAAEPVQTDPTVANASLTEIESGTDIALTNGHTDDAPAEAAIPNADVGDNAANAAGEKQWDTGNDMAASQEWVEVDIPAETPQTEAAPSAPPAAAATTSQSWADDHPEPSSEPATPSDPNDGFQSVPQRNRGRGDRDGSFRGGNRGHFRGRGGFRGDGHRGRGRGGSRGGGRGGFRREGVEASS